jgi:Domain of unknown function (DUF1963)
MEHLTIDNLKEKLINVKRVAAIPVVRSGDGILTASKYGGKPWLNVDEDYPLCPNCGKPMQLFLQLNLDEIPEHFKSQFGSGLFQLFYCNNVVYAEYGTGLFGKTTEEYEAFMSDVKAIIASVKDKIVNYPHSMSLEYKDDGTWEIKVGEILQNCSSECQGWDAFSKCQIARIVQPIGTPKNFELSKTENSLEPKLIIGWTEVDDYPYFTEIDIDDLVEIELDEEEEESIQDDLIDLHQYDDKLGGWPTWMRDPEFPNCPTCARLMDRFIFQLGSDDYSVLDRGYIVQCSEHKEQVAFFAQH